MSNLRAGNVVRCIKASHDAKVGELHIVACPDIDGTMMIENCAWWHSQSDFELVSPPQPVEVHTGGPYVARSEYERVCVERDEGWASGARIRNEAAKLGQERDALQKQVVSLQDHFRRLTRERDDALRHVEFQQKQIADLINRQSNPNGWPLVPVDPSCIPAGHRAVEVTKNTQGKLVASHNVRRFSEDDNYPRLVVEPIPTPQAPDTLPRPEFPAWIRAGWWVAMDNDGDWFAYNNEPEMLESLNQWKSGNPFFITADQKTPSMRVIPVTRWREAKWQVE